MTLLRGALLHSGQAMWRVCLQFGGPYGDPFNNPPFITHFLKVLPATEWFPFWLRLPSIPADIGTSTVGTKPVSILISGFHGNVDPMMVFWLVGAIWAVRKENFWLAGMAFGMAINIKVVPLLLLPCFLLYVRKRVAFSFGAIITVLLLSLPYAVETSATSLWH